VPPTSLEQADELINEELFRLLEHDNAKYPLDEKTQKEKKKGSKRQQNGGPLVPEIDDFDEDELKEVLFFFSALLYWHLTIHDELLSPLSL